MSQLVHTNTFDHVQTDLLFAGLSLGIPFAKRPPRPGGPAMGPEGIEDDVGAWAF